MTDPDPLAPHIRTQVLIEALPYIRRFWGTTVVVKFGGNAMVDAALARQFADDIVLLHAVGLRIVVVHGGGPQISEAMAKFGKVPEFREGQRVTDAETLEIVRMVLVGKVGRDIVSSIIVERLLAEHLIPVVSTIGSDAAGQAYNINADAVAGALAGALGAEKVLYLTDVAGVMRDLHDPSTLMTELTPSQIRDLIAQGVIDGGMIPKTEACITALDRGAKAAHLLDGRVPHALLLEIFTDTGIGTMVVPDGGQREPT
jgi:acetylglutamate kinase